MDFFNQKKYNSVSKYITVHCTLVSIDKVKQFMGHSFTNTLQPQGIVANKVKRIKFKNFLH